MYLNHSFSYEFTTSSNLIFLSLGQGRWFVTHSHHTTPNLQSNPTESILDQRPLAMTSSNAGQRALDMHSVLRKGDMTTMYLTILQIFCALFLLFGTIVACYVTFLCTCTPEHCIGCRKKRVTVPLSAIIIQAQNAKMRQAESATSV